MWVASAFGKPDADPKLPRLCGKHPKIISLQAGVTLNHELSLFRHQHQPWEARPKPNPFWSTAQTFRNGAEQPSAAHEPSPEAPASAHWRDKLFSNSHCSDLTTTLAQDTLLSHFEKDPINFGLFFPAFLQRDIYCTKDWCGATCVKQPHTRRKHHFTTIIYPFFNWILDFFKCVSLRVVQCTFNVFHEQYCRTYSWQQEGRSVLNLFYMQLEKQKSNTVVTWTAHIRDMHAWGHGEWGWLLHIWEHLGQLWSRTLGQQNVPI